MIDHNIDYCPWLYINGATEEQKQAQQLVQDELRALGHEFGENAFASPMANYEGKVALGNNSYVAAGALVGDALTVGDDCSINAYAVVRGKITIGNYTRIGGQAHILGFNHVADDVTRPIHQQGIMAKGITIGDDVWIGSGCIILDGVTIGSHSIIGAGAVVTKDIPEYSVAVGNPARVIRDRRGRQGKSKVVHLLEQFSETVHNEWQAVLADYRREDGVYIDPQAGQQTVRALADAIEIAAMFDAVETIGDSQTLAEHLQALQDPITGLIPEHAEETPLTIRGTAGYHILSVGYALECLGTTFKHPIHAVNNLDAEALYNELAHLPWAEHAWSAGAWIDHYATGVYFNQRYFDDMRGIEPLMGWLHTNAKPASGLWGEPTAQQKWLLPVNGFYRLTRGSYAQFGLPLPYPETTIDTIFTHIRQYDDFMTHDVTACNVLDVVHPLWLCSQQTAYRRKEILQYIERQLVRTIPTWISERGFAFSDEYPTGLQGTEMWLSIVYIMADMLGLAQYLGYKPRGVHRK